MQICSYLRVSYLALTANSQCWLVDSFLVIKGIRNVCDCVVVLLLSSHEESSTFDIIGNERACVRRHREFLHGGGRPNQTWGG